jgi:hypothetical protein
MKKNKLIHDTVLNLARTNLTGNLSYWTKALTIKEDIFSDPDYTKKYWQTAAEIVILATNALSETND